MPELNEPQSQAVSHLTGPLLVFAGAGSGKTRTITYRIANLLGQGVPPYRILSVTFTNKAAGEMKARLEQLAGAELVRDLWVGTFHSVCARLLRRYHAEVGLERNFVIYDESDQKAIVARILKESGSSDRETTPKQMLSRILSKKQEGLGPQDLADQRRGEQELATVFGKYEQALKASNAVDFEDLLTLVMKLAESTSNAAGAELRSRFDHVLVDEFQDTNLVQYRLVRAFSAGTRNLCVVGDDDQSIYRWRGADVQIIRGFRKDFPDALVVKLEQNYRSSGHIVKAALAVIEPARHREPKELWTAAEMGQPILIRAAADERDEAAWVVRGVRSRMRAGIDARQLAVFYRTHAQSRVLEEAFRAESIAYQIIGGMRFFDRAEVKDLLGYLRLIDNPRSEADLMRVINVPARGIGKKTLEVLHALASEHSTSLYEALPAAVRDAGLGSAARSKLKQFVELVEEWRNNARQLSPHALATRVFSESGYRALLEAEDSAEADARLGNVQELLGAIAEYEDDAAAAGEEGSLTGYLERVSLVASTDSLKDVPKVSLMTVHAAKGLEFNTVFLTGMEEDVFPYRRIDATGPEELDEERRLAYVAITRARELLLVSHASQRTLFGQTRYLAQSSFLEDLPRDCCKREESDVRLARRERAWSEHVVERWKSSGGGPTPSLGMTGSRSASSSGAGTVLRPGERIVDRSAFDDLPADEVSSTIRPGQLVFHARFGRGKVERVEPGSDGPTVVAFFQGFGPRKILARFLTTTTDHP